MGQPKDPLLSCLSHPSFPSYPMILKEARLQNRLADGRTEVKLTIEARKVSVIEEKEHDVPMREAIVPSVPSVLSGDLIGRPP